MTSRKERRTGSLPKGEPDFLAAGKIRRPHGVRGEILVEILTDFPERLKPGKVVFLGEKHLQVSIRNQRTHKDGLLLGFDGYNSPEDIGVFRNQILYVDEADRPQLATGEYYIHELIDMKVMKDDGTFLGSLTEVIETRANDVYVVTSQEGIEILLPAIPGVIQDVDLEHRRMTVHLLPGLLDDKSDEI